MDIEDLTGYCPKRGAPCTGVCHDSPHEGAGSQPMGVVLRGKRVWYRVTDIAQLLEAFRRIVDDQYMLVAGNTAQGVTRISECINTYIDIGPIAEMHCVVQTADSLTIGSLVTLTETIRVLKAATKLKGFEYCQMLVDHMEMVANVPVRNV